MDSSGMSSSDKPLKSRWRLDRDLVHAITCDRTDVSDNSAPRRDDAWCEAVALDVVSAAHLAQLSGVTELEVMQMVEYGVLTPAPPLCEPWQFPAACVPILCRAQSLRNDFAFDGDEFALALMIIFELERLEARSRIDPATKPERDGGSKG